MTDNVAPGFPVPIPTLPFASMMKAVEVADAVEVEMANRFWLSRVAVEVAAMERRAKGEVVPMPTDPIPELPSPPVRTIVGLVLLFPSIMELEMLLTNRFVALTPLPSTKELLAVALIH